MSTARVSQRKPGIGRPPASSPELAPVEPMESVIINARVPAPDLALPEPLLPDMEMPDVEPMVPRIPSLDECLAALLALFPDIDPEHVRALYEEHVWNEGGNVMEVLVDLVLEAKGNHPKVQREDRSTKRKRERSPSEMTADELDNKYNHARRSPPGPGYINLSRKHLRNAFPFIPATAIDVEFGRKRNFLFPAYKSLAQAEAGHEKANAKPYKKLGRPRKAVSDSILLHEGEKLGIDERTSLMDELAAAQRIYEHLTVKGRIQAGASGSAEIAEGSTDEALFECGCCFGEVPFLQLTQCSDGHLFCLDCGKRNAETEIGQQKYKLLCMDTSGCRKEFPIQEIKRFCDEKMLETLERLEQRDSLREAGIDDLAECPFCDFAAILPPVEHDREFRCHNPDCMKVSCRLCDKETHIPLTCEEKAKEESSSLRRNVEEAMTEALLRKCGKCGLPYVKESGCNKIVCTRCSATNCYLCSKVIKDYKHFNDPNRGGKAGNCLLFDNTDERHHNEVQAAEQAAINKIRAENPDISEEEMRIRLSKVVLDGERQRIEEGNRRLGINNPAPIAGGVPVDQLARPNIPAQPFVFRAVQPVRFPVHVPQAPPLPILGNPVPFVGANQPMIPLGAVPPVHAPQPVNILQRFAGLLPIARPIMRARAVPIHVQHLQYGAVQVAPNPQNRNAVPVANLNQIPHPQPPANPPAQAPPAQQENAGFIQRNFNLGGNRLVARGRQAARAPNNLQRPPPRPLTFIDHNVQGMAAQLAGPANDKPAPVPQPRNRPSKIAKRGSR
ncbi:hypothetical protein TWF696_004755 [Orbilia brochopaga]|uniref:RING-type domain-containing protein n=1 Tax=Orbilia brochopaga TaxID=3140254 RepID=A0AAV9V2N6_9PEZI